MEATIEVTGLDKRFGRVQVLDGALIIQGISAERLVASLSEHAIPFTEVSPQRVSLEQAYQDLTRDSVEYRAAP